MILNIHAGHNPEGKIACGACGILNESREDRIIKDNVISMLRSMGHTVYDCTVDDGTSQSDVLAKIINKCNAHSVDLDVSIHLNSGRNDYVGDGSIGGTEVFCFSTASKAKPYAQKVVEAISELGFRIRDDKIPDEIKTSTSLHVLKKSKAPAMLIECCFVDDADDSKIYNASSMASAIVKGITGISGSVAPSNPTPSPSIPIQTEGYSQTQFITDVQKALGFTGSKVDGKAVANGSTINATITVSALKNKRHALVTPLERRLKSLGFYSGSIEVDECKTPLFGNGMTKAVNAYQKSYGGKGTDGEVTVKGSCWKHLLGIL